ncbi:MAG TPA: translation initiation factor IF-2 subunit gamma, partial [bacterium]|nr:translation initiation factor IF-2 subunit gamma [bacterium]
YETVKTKVVGFHKAGKNLDSLEPGGLAGIMTMLDPALAKSDGLSGNVAGRVGKLPPIFSEISMEYNALKRVVVSKEEESYPSPKMGDALLLNIGMSRTIGVVKSIKGEKIYMSLKLPICAEKGDRIAISQQVLGRWRLTGHGKLL